MDMAKLTTDEELVEKIISGELELFEEIFNRYQPKLIRYVFSMVRDFSLANDIVQETLIKVYKNLNGFNSKYKFSSWAYRIAHNETMNSIKRNKRVVQEVNIDLIPDLTYETRTDSEIDGQILSQSVKNCLNLLPPKYREIVILQYYENMKYEEISDILKMPISTVGVRSLRAKQKLKLICEREGVKYEQEK